MGAGEDYFFGVLSPGLDGDDFGAGFFGVSGMLHTLVCKSVGHYAGPDPNVPECRANEMSYLALMSYLDFYG